MKRSEINLAINEAFQFFKDMNIVLPKWAYWKPDQWKDMGSIVGEVMERGLGWDITDFGSGDFENIGLINFNTRNGSLTDKDKPYCEKIIVVKENQVTPNHTHHIKKEDIINRGGGNLVIQLFHGDFDGNLTDEDITVKIDSIPVTVAAGGTVTLEPGESIYLLPGVYHEFWGENGKGKVLVVEVSSVNDDATDNIFVNTIPRFPTIEEDEAPEYLLVNDYKKYIQPHL
ncbi:D-lyxose/D-mannose family sugar isomerase [uncultured Kriegella sp.]|uniref:D-lyxose/D-mannose family sugar isomerase n=1 Tax=uncultured Kriegella sp. TaxID=1798910 RepID=UPI0030D80997|tara:strand:+ start:166046 stop:166732 length:687 start_codon:yes stop_codon:yes gene_type:complete